ncbi:MAG TPA: MFS transporter, partial [Erythrobacter sp.]|nr:MFS transporter [Erythrobacter sp.]
MLSVLTNRTYRHLFLAQVIALVGTGLATVALGLLAYDLAGADAGAVLGTALAIKMVAYVGIAPLAGAYADKLPRKRLLVGMDIVRAGVALLLPFVDAVWQIYLLIFLLQSASAVFTPTFQATIPDILPDEEKYTKALSLSRLAYDLESLISPVLAAALLTILSFHWLFAGTAVGFVISALLVMSAALPDRKSVAKRVEGVWRKTTRGMRVYLKTPRLVGLLAVTLAAAAGSAMVIVNTVVIVKNMGGTEGDVALALAAYGAGSMMAALALPRILTRIDDRTIMIAGGGLLLVTLATIGLVFGQLGPRTFWPVVLVGWLTMGIGYSLCVTPNGRLLKRSSADARTFRGNAR